MNRFPKAEPFDLSIVREKIMGPNPLKLAEELLESHQIPQGGVVLDLGSGTGITSALLAREYGFTVYAADLWSTPGENMRFFESLGLTNKNVIPLRIDASKGLPFADCFFDAVVSIDSYNYFGRDPKYLGENLLPYVKPGGYLYLAIPGMHKDCHDDLPQELLTSWTPDQLDYIHDMEWWRALISMTEGVRIVDMHEMACHREAWRDWVACDNEYAAGDRQAWDAGAVEYLNSIAITLRKLQ
ncbi:SAM-dependent methyltransferase [Collinsella aerofaciens]|uniref:SAM-dependent methyltransferase n=1 Tax=Collinsella aerofaciens TaxID=74426 RepID=UPI003D790980